MKTSRGALSRLAKEEERRGKVSAAEPHTFFFPYTAKRLKASARPAFSPSPFFSPFRLPRGKREREGEKTILAERSAKSRRPTDDRCSHRRPAEKKGKKSRRKKGWGKRKRQGEMGRLVILVGPSGAGKTSIATRSGMHLLCGMTTRAPRDGEVEGRDFYFVTPDAFERLVERDALFSHNMYAGMRYGVPRSLVETVGAASDEARFVVIVSIDVAERLRDALGLENTLIVRIGCSLDALGARLVKRGAAAADVERRMRQAADVETSLAFIARCDASIENHDGALDAALAQLQKEVEKRWPRHTKGHSFSPPRI